MSLFALTIRREQARALSEAVEEQFLSSMRQCVAPERAGRLEEAIREARGRGLVRASELRQYVELWAELPGGAWPAWMESVWTDKWISSPSARLNRILELQQHRQAVEVHNRELRQRFDQGRV